MKIKKLAVWFLLLPALCGILTLSVCANSARPPNLTVVAAFPPEDLTLAVRLGDGQIVQGDSEQTAWERRYNFYFWDLSAALPSYEGAKLLVQTATVQFECDFPAAAYDDVYTLHLDSRSLTAGQTPLRAATLVSMRVLLTLLIEGLVLLAFKYRAKASWAAFLVVNLITQGGLNLLLTGPQVTMDLSLRFVGLIVLELIILIVEMIAFAVIFKEHSKRRAVLFAAVANMASLVLGGALLLLLPV